MDEKPKRIPLTREELYEKLWQTPTTHLAEELGTSDVRLGKLCKEYRIPKPYVGYWAKKEHGKDPAKTPLPANDDPERQTLIFTKYPPREEPAYSIPGEDSYGDEILACLARARALPPIVVKSSLRAMHPLVQATKDALEVEEMLDRKGVPWCDRPRHVQTLDISVSWGTRHRALRIYDAVVKGIETIGGRVENVKEFRQERTLVTIAGEDATDIRIRERLKRRRVPPEEREGGWGRAYEDTPCGILLIDDHCSRGSSPLCQDTPKRKKLEDRINEFLVRLVQMAGEKRAKRIEKEQEEHRRAEAELQRQEREAELARRRAELQGEQEREQRRVDVLMADACDWQSVKVLRCYLDAVAGISDEEFEQLYPGWAREELLAWAGQQADRLDPFSPSPHSVLDESIQD